MGRLRLEHQINISSTVGLIKETEMEDKVKCEEAKIKRIDNGWLIETTYPTYRVPSEKIFCASLDNAFEIVRTRMTTEVTVK